jgi:segregation and condensation protein A
MSYEIELEIFEGPLDLLLHLIHRNEVAIEDIPIALITKQYLDTIELMKSLNLDVAGEYLVMASYLTHIKSRLLLPADDTGESPDEGADPRDELVSHLLEYKRYKEAAEHLSEMDTLDSEVFTREYAQDGPETPISGRPIDVRPADLVAAFKALLERTSRRDLLEVEPDRLLVKDKINEILEKLRSVEWTTFGSLFVEDASRINLVTTFLALLELVKLQVVKIYQDSPFGTILISRRLAPEAIQEGAVIDDEIKGAG